MDGLGNSLSSSYQSHPPPSHFCQGAFPPGHPESLLIYLVNAILFYFSTFAGAWLPVRGTSQPGVLACWELHRNRPAHRPPSPQVRDSRLSPGPCPPLRLAMDPFYASYSSPWPAAGSQVIVSRPGLRRRLPVQLGPQWPPDFSFPNNCI